MLKHLLNQYITELHRLFDENGKYIPETVSLKFTNKEANAAIADYLELVRYEKINGITFDKTKSSSDAKDRLMMYFNLNYSRADKMLKITKPCSSSF